MNGLFCLLYSFAKNSESVIEFVSVSFALKVTSVVILLGILLAIFLASLVVILFGIGTS